MLHGQCHRQMPFALGNSELSCVIAGLRVPVLGMPYPERDLAGNSYSYQDPRQAVRDVRGCGGFRQHPARAPRFEVVAVIKETPANRKRTSAAADMLEAGSGSPFGLFALFYTSAPEGLPSGL
jgi:hypothetical protein